MTLQFITCQSVACLFDQTLTPNVLSFEIFILIGALIVLGLFYLIDKKVLWRFLIIAIGVFLFEFFTTPMWHNYHLGAWAYVYRDVSWILTIGWSIFILVPVVLIDKLLPRIHNGWRFLLYLLAVLIFGILGETAVVNLGIRGYSPETLAAIGGNYVPFLNIPWAIFYYLPVFMALVIGFYQYWALALEKMPLLPMKKGHWWRNLLISLVGVFLFEIMVEPMVVNANLPWWSYVYRDISFFITGGWVLIIWLAIQLVDKFTLHLAQYKKFFLYVIAATVITLPIEAALILNNIRQYGPSATDNFSGFMVPWFNIPAEVAFAIPFYLILMIAFIKYWIYKFDNKI